MAAHKYVDAPRFPKIQLKYEGDFKTNYQKTLENMTKDIGKKMLEIINRKKK